MRRTEWLGELRQDARFGLRQFLRNPGFTLIAVLTLALGIGANSAIFTVINAVLLRPLEYRAPDELVYVYSQFPTIGFDEFWISPPEYRDLQAQLRSFSSIGGWRTGSTATRRWRCWPTAARTRSAAGSWAARPHLPAQPRRAGGGRTMDRRSPLRLGEAARPARGICDGNEGERG